MKKSNLLVQSLVSLALVAGVSSCGTRDDQVENDDMSLIESASVEPSNESLETVKISHCHDGDTCSGTFQKTGQFVQMRLAGLDAPEVSTNTGRGTAQPMGKDARNYLNEMVGRKTVKVRKVDQDMYGRTVAEIYFNGQLVNLKILTNGYAEFYRWAPNRINKPAYAAAERRAKAYEKGIWSIEGYQSPSEFRRKFNTRPAKQ